MRRVIILCFLIIAVLSTQLVSVNALEPDTREALKFTKPPTIDGTISAEEWGDPTVKGIKHGEPSNAIAKDSSQDITFDVWVRWDDNNVYIALQTPDEKLINLNTGELMWNGDAVQLEVDPLGNWQSQGKSDYTYVSENAREIVYSNNSNDHKAQAWCYTLGGEPEGEYSISNVDGTTTYEISIPWSFFDVDGPGEEIGLTIALLTCSSYTYDGWLEYGSGCIMEKAEEDKSGNNKIVLSETEFTPADTYTTFNPTPSPTPEETDDGSDGDTEKGGVDPVVIIVVAAVAAIALIVIIIIIRMKKKK
ncbi:MAG TPA: hypothetical protein GXZ66_11980 [Clostridiaceae bacterium]|jgi:hypothetical protein|nr:hypothetical protein [Clostridiaceae bacterium]